MASVIAKVLTSVSLPAAASQWPKVAYVFSTWYVVTPSVVVPTCDASPSSGVKYQLPARLPSSSTVQSSLAQKAVPIMPR